MNYNFRFNSFISKILASGITFLGFGCSSFTDGPDEPILLMYGCPTGEFKIKGKVSSEDGNPIKDAILRVAAPEFNSYPHPSLESKTDESGNFSLQAQGTTIKKVKVVCVPESETLNPDSTLVDLEYVSPNGDPNAWYIGEAEATVNFVLKKKDNK